MINDNLVARFLGLLPLKAEEEEAQKCHLLVLKEAAKENPRLVNANTLLAFKAAVVKMRTMQPTV